jgi:methionyl-tRNA formyltransferase
MNIGLLASGNLGFEALQNLLLEQEVIFVFTNKDSLTIIQLCEKTNIAYFIGNPRNERANDFLLGREIDVLISVNYLFIIEENLINLPKKIAFNIHGSLLPKYRGRTPHVWAIINNEKNTGITAHIIDTGCDTGDIIEQVKVAISKEDTGADILNKYNLLYIPLIKSVLDKIENGKLNTTSQDDSKATFFGKRSPGDGQINWNWQRERVYNWVRAQAYPYPGAFTFYKVKKVIIDEINLVDYAFDYNMPNGLIIEINPMLVKTPNGVVEIKKMRAELCNIQEGEIFK